MLNILKLISITALLTIAFTVPGFSSTDTVYGFYGGLADIIERNMNAPDTCVTEVNSFVQTNLPALAQNMQKNIQTAETIDYENMSEAEARQMTADVERTLGMQQSDLMNEGMNAMNRFTTALTTFSMRYPEHAEKIGESLEQVSEELGFY